jgi:predicted transcriptional regulator
MQRPPTPRQVRAARALLDMTRENLSRRSGVSLRALAAFEAGQSQLMPNNHRAVREALEMRGIRFDGFGGVRIVD